MMVSPTGRGIDPACIGVRREPSLGEVIYDSKPARKTKCGQICSQ